MPGRAWLYPPLIPKREVRAYGKMPWDSVPGITFPLRSVMLLNGASPSLRGGCSHRTTTTARELSRRPLSCRRQFPAPGRFAPHRETE